MAIALLENTGQYHSPIHDLESFFWVLLYCSVHIVVDQRKAQAAKESSDKTAKEKSSRQDDLDSRLADCFTLGRDTIETSNAKCMSRSGTFRSPGSCRSDIPVASGLSRVQDRPPVDTSPIRCSRSSPVAPAVLPSRYRGSGHTP